MKGSNISASETWKNREEIPHDKNEEHEFCGIVGTLIFLENGVVPQT